MHSDGKDDVLAPRFDGRFSDGTSAGSKRVDVRLSQRGLLIFIPETAEPIVWAYNTLSVAEPLRKNSIEALVTHSRQGSATLFVPGAAFARSLASLAPHLTTRGERWRNARPWLLATLAVSLIIGVIYVAELTPARYLASLIPEKVRDSMGKSSVRSMLGEHAVCVAREGRVALDHLVSKLSRASGSKTAFKVKVADWGLLNAFTTPGSYIIVTRTLITTARSPDELAGVLAHEMGHGISLHPETGIVRAVGLTATMELLTGGGGGTVANFGLLLAQLSYTRSAEREADEQALRILKAAKISPAGLESFFKRVSKLEAKSSRSEDQKSNNPQKKTSWARGFDILRSHPSPLDRLARVKRQPKYTSTPALGAKEWSALKHICSATNHELNKAMNRSKGLDVSPADTGDKSDLNK